MTRRTPCIGICSTTYGDMVCRGCKRSAHEIVAWNGYSDDQQRLVLARLDTFKAECVQRFVTIEDADRLERSIVRLHVPVLEAASRATLAFELLRHAGQRLASLADGGLAAKAAARVDDPRSLRDVLDREVYARACAEYERAHRLPAF